MRFTIRKRRQPPAIIIISLIDILIVLLIFLMVTTTFKQRPAVKLTLPESKQAVQGATQDKLVITLNKVEPLFYFKALPVTLEKLQSSLQEEAKLHPGIGITVYADEGATIGNQIKLMDAARAAGLTDVRMKTRNATSK
jgi:biopolymer transport protein ExbD